jgi:hypothetical protein
MKLQGEPTASTRKEKMNRLKICKDCSSYAHKQFGGMCMECFCVLDVKTGLKAEKCPLGKW